MRKNVLNAYRMIDQQSLGADITSDPTNVINLDLGSILVEWTGTSPVGNLIVEGRMVKVEAPTQATAWIQLDFGSTISISGNSGTHSLIFDELPFTQLRLRYARTSGTGSLTATVVLKQVGG